MSFQTTGIPKEWDERGAMTPQTISKQHTGGVTEKKDQPESMTNGRSVISSHLEKNAETALKIMCCEIGRDGGKIVLPCRRKFPPRDKSFFQGRFGAASIFVQAIRWTPT